MSTFTSEGKAIIKYYRKNIYGNEREYVANRDDANIIAQITGRDCVTPTIRELFRDLTGGYIIWEETITPRKN